MNELTPLERFQQLSPELQEKAISVATEESLKDLFEERKYWRGAELNWCHLCETYCIICPDCKNSSCNGGGCEKCCGATEGFISTDFSNLTKHSIENYLTEEEILTYRKISYIKKYVLECLSVGFNEINWPYLSKNGLLSNYSYKLFPKETENLPPYKHE